MAVKKASEQWQTFMKKMLSQLSHRIKNIHQSKLCQYHTDWRKSFSQLIFKDCELLLFYTVVCMSHLCISRLKNAKEILFMKGKFSFLYVDICLI